MKHFLQIATGQIKQSARFIPESVSLIRIEEGRDGRIIFFATAIGVSEGVQNAHAIHEFDRATPLEEVIAVLGASSKAVARQLVTPGGGQG